MTIRSCESKTHFFFIKTVLYSYFEYNLPKIESKTMKSFFNGSKKTEKSKFDETWQKIFILISFFFHWNSWKRFCFYTILFQTIDRQQIWVMALSMVLLKMYRYTSQPAHMIHLFANTNGVTFTYPNNSITFVVILCMHSIYSIIVHIKVNITFNQTFG